MMFSTVISQITIMQIPNTKSFVYVDAGHSFIEQITTIALFVSRTL